MQVNPDPPDHSEVSVDEVYPVRGGRASSELSEESTNLGKLVFEPCSDILLCGEGTLVLLVGVLVRGSLWCCQAKWHCVKVFCATVGGAAVRIGAAIAA